MNCPKCAGILAKHEFSDSIAAYRCGDCCGILIERDVLKRIRDEVRADEFFDIGHPKVGQAMDGIRTYNCPRCRQAMVPATNERQQHIRFETCSKCGLFYFDAGELIDFSNETVLEKVWGFLTGTIKR